MRTNKQQRLQQSGHRLSHSLIQDTALLPCGSKVFPGRLCSLAMLLAALFLTGAAARAAAPVISVQPADVTLCYGQQATLSVQATGASLFYQWYAGTQGDTSSPLAGATSATYLTAGMLKSASYWVQVTNTSGATASRTVQVSLTDHTPLYFTDFESYPVGTGAWSDTDGWWTVLDWASMSGILGTNAGLGTGKAAFIGNGTTTNTSAYIIHDFLYGPLGKANQVNYSADIEIMDSPNATRDYFDFVFWNRSEQTLARLEFDNTQKAIWTFNGAAWSAWGFFVKNHVYHLWLGIDFQSNLWSMVLNGQTVFTNAPLNATGAALDFAQLWVAWTQAGSKPGANYMIVDNVGIAAEGTWGPLFAAPKLLGNGKLQWNVLAVPGQNLSLETSTDLRAWHAFTTLSNALATNTIAVGLTNAGGQFYRVKVLP